MILTFAAAVAIVAAIAGSGVFGALDPYSVDDPSSESVAVQRELERKTGSSMQFDVVALVRLDGDLWGAAARARVRRVALEIGRDPAIAQVLTWYTAREPSMVARDRRATVVVGHLRPLSDRAREAAGRRLSRVLAREHGVAAGGLAPALAQVSERVSADLTRAELLAVPILALLCMWLFRGPLAAALPLVVAGLAIVVTFAAMRVVVGITPIAAFVLNMVTGLGLGLAIDYCLLIVTRYRECRATGHDEHAAVRTAMSTAGPTILFSSLTVAAALASLLVFPQRYIYSMGVGGALVALAAAASALTLTPAILTLLGDRIDAWSPRRLTRAARRDAELAGSGGWRGVARHVTRRPLAVAIVSAALLLAAGSQFLDARFVGIDGGVLPRGAPARTVHDTLERDFPPYRTLPITVLAGVGATGALDRLRVRLRRLPGVSQVGPALPVDDATTLIRVVSASPPLSSESERLVRRIRALEAPFAMRVGGLAAGFVDQRASIVGHLPPALALAAGSTFLLLMFFTGSVVLPLKALMFNALTLCAALGFLVFLFQRGRLEGPLGYTGRGALEISQPVILAAVVFGLATDYSVFLLSRVREERARGLGEREAIAEGLARTGRVITSAALILCVAVALFATSGVIFIKELGLGVAFAIIVDATIVRALLAPALMTLLGRWNWWAPGRLRPWLSRAPGCGSV